MSETVEGENPFTAFVDHNMKVCETKMSPIKSSVMIADTSQLDDLMKLGDRKKIKKFLRSNQWPANHEVRRTLWWKLCCGCKGRSDTKVTYNVTYNETAQEVFGAEGDVEHFIPLPSFVDIRHLEHYHLSETGVRTAKKLLNVIAHERPDIIYSPLLFAVTCLLLHYMDEQGCYDCISCLINSKEKYLAQTKTAYEASAFVLKELTKKYAKASFQSIAKRTSDVEFVLESWLWWITKKLPFSYIVHIMDCYLFEGPKVLYRVALAILIQYHKHMVKSSPAKGDDVEIRNEIEQFCQNIPLSSKKLLKTAFGIRGLSRSEIRKIILQMEIYVQSKHNAAALQGNMPNSPSAGSLSLLVTKDSGSSIVARKDWREIYSWVPKRFTLKQPKLIFTTCEHGTSLSTLYNRIEGYEPTFIIIKTSKQESFGAYCSVDWLERKRNLQYFGTGESFVFSLAPKKEKYSWVGVLLVDKTPNSAHLFLSGDSTRISIGGGNGSAILLDENLYKGVTEHCDTFDNPPLVAGSQFTVVVLEVFAFE